MGVDNKKDVTLWRYQCVIRTRVSQMVSPEVFFLYRDNTLFRFIPQGNEMRSYVIRVFVSRKEGWHEKCYFFSI